jgi:PhnB protein
MVDPLTAAAGLDTVGEHSFDAIEEAAMGDVQAIPAGFEGATPYLTVNDGAAALDFYTKAFGAVETVRMPDPEGKIGHAEFKIGGATIMLSDEYPEMDVVSPTTLGGATSGLMVYVEDVDAVFAQAVAAGAEVLKPVELQFYGDRSAQLRDPFGHKWFIATHVEDVDDAEMERRAAKYYEEHPT